MVCALISNVVMFVFGSEWKSKQYVNNKVFESNKTQWIFRPLVFIRQTNVHYCNEKMSLILDYFGIDMM